MHITIEQDGVSRATTNNVVGRALQRVNPLLYVHKVPLKKSQSLLIRVVPLGY